MMSIDWNRLRSFGASQRTAFEVLCCQLAEHETVPQGAKFIRKGTPDAGIECFWRLPNGDEWGWQAKFFLSSPTNTQWGEIDKSVKNAIEKHPKLTKYTICLPIDRPDPRIRGRESVMDKWNNHVKKWKKWSLMKGIEAEFPYWGEHQIWERLSKEEHRGRYLFWFNQQFFSNRWFEDNLKEVIVNAGPRYSPELNVELPIARLFEGLGRTDSFYQEIKIRYGKIKKAYKNLRFDEDDKLIGGQLKLLNINIGKLFDILDCIGFSEIEVIESSEAMTYCTEGHNISWECGNILEKEAQKKSRAEGSVNNQREYAPRVGYSHNDPFSHERHWLYELANELYGLKDFFGSNETQLATVGSLLILGNAGTGKTHLFCDVAKHRSQENLPTILLLGSHFHTGEPWSQIIRELGLSCDRDEFLGALEAAAQARGKKALILIDALNEGEGKTLWGKYLAGMLESLSRYKWISAGFSVRTSYATTIIPEGLIPSKLIEEEHHGFHDFGYDAVRTFFEHYNIELPQVPLLVPEFENPLFLKLFCQGLKNRNLTMVPSGVKGITDVFSFFIDSVNDKLSNQDTLNFNPRFHIVQKAVNLLSELMAQKGNYWISYEEVESVIDNLVQPGNYDRSLTRHMIAEGILAEDKYMDSDNNWLDAVHFSYERMADHQIAQYLLDKYLNSENPSSSFIETNPLGRFCKDGNSCWRNKGLIEAFCIQLPERISKELTELVPRCATYRPVQEAFIDSLIWRDPKSVFDFTLKYINNHIIHDKELNSRFFNAILTIAAKPEHPYNADFLHKNLVKHKLPDRDAWWSIFLYEEYEKKNAVDRLVDWAFSNADKDHLTDEAIRLYGTALAWFLTTSHRFLRDRATKALVTLFERRIHVLRKVVSSFKDVNDPYVQERIWAVAYGCVLRSGDTTSIKALAEDTYTWIFKDGNPPVHILMRDYARGIIEAALAQGMKLDLDEKKIRPPYSSNWPSDIPTEEDVKYKHEIKLEMSDEDRAELHIYNSVLGQGDFSIYILNSDYSQWYSHRLNEPQEKSRKEITDNFIKSLTERQQTAWNNYQEAKRSYVFYRDLDEDTKRSMIEKIYAKNEIVEIFGEQLSANEVKLKIQQLFNDESITELSRATNLAGNVFRKTLGKGKTKTYDTLVVPYFENPDAFLNEFHFDIASAKRWIYKKVFNLGWTKEKFGVFEREVGGRGREPNKPERISKKYQWIAHHELLARASDNFQLKGAYWEKDTAKFEGPWQFISVRDIDPSCVLKSTGDDGWKKHSNTWWFPTPYSSWNKIEDDVEWLKSTDDLPDISQLLDVTNPDDGSRWVAFEGFYSWEQPIPPEEERIDYGFREVWYMVNSYLVRKPDSNKVFSWAKSQDFWGRWMPESRDHNPAFIGEFFWAPAFLHHHYHNWTRGNDNRIPKPVLVSTLEYMSEKGTCDCSIDKTYSIQFPTKHLVDEMKLSWNGQEGRLFDLHGNLVAFDPSVKLGGPSVLLVNKKLLLQFLMNSGYDMFWTLLGEKRKIGKGWSGDDYKGALEISGAYRMKEGAWEGASTPRFKEPPSPR